MQRSSSAVRVAVLSFAVLSFAGEQAASASVLFGDTVSATLVSGNTSLWGVAGGPQSIPVGYDLNTPFIPILDLSLDVNGLITITPDPTSCGSGCGWNLGGATFEFTLDPSAPVIIGLTTILSDPNLGATLLDVDGSSFEVQFSGTGSGTTNADVTQGQLLFAPEPGSLLLIGCGLTYFAVLRRRNLGKKLPAERN